jgi:hypothetical protein
LYAESEARGQAPDIINPGNRSQKDCTDNDQNRLFKLSNLDIDHQPCHQNDRHDSESAANRRRHRMAAALVRMIEDGVAAQEAEHDRGRTEGCGGNGKQARGEQNQHHAPAPGAKPFVLIA